MSEFSALRRVFDSKIRRWAIEQATLHNAHFQTDGIPWTADDFLGRSDREARKAQKAKDDIDVMRERMRLAAMRPNAPPPADCPEWAIGEYRGVVSMDPPKPPQALIDKARSLFPDRYDLQEPVS